MANSIIVNTRAIDKPVNKTVARSEKTYPYRPRVKGEYYDLDRQWDAVLQAQMRGGICQWNAKGHGRTVGGDDAMPREWMPIEQLIATLTALPRLAEFDDDEFTQLFLDALQDGDFLEVPSKGKYRLRGGDGVILCKAGPLEVIATYMDVRDARRESNRAERAQRDAERAARCAEDALAKARRMPARAKA
jgi:hypothetical protein